MSTCVVLTQGYRNHTCQAKYARYPCFSAAWDIQLKAMPLINATAESIYKYRSIDEALEKMKERQVL